MRGWEVGSAHTLSGEPDTPCGPLLACQYYEHGGARWVNNLILTSNFHGRPRGKCGGRGRYLLLMLSPSSDLHSSQLLLKPPFKKWLSATVTTTTSSSTFHTHTHTHPLTVPGTHLEAHVHLHFQSSDLRLNYIWSVLARYNSDWLALLDTPASPFRHTLQKLSRLEGKSAAGFIY